VQYIDAGAQAGSKRRKITAEGTVFMDVLVENTQVDNGIARIQGIPALDTQSRGNQDTGSRWRNGGHRRRDRFFSRT